MAGALAKIGLNDWLNKEQVVERLDPVFNPQEQAAPINQVIPTSKNPVMTNTWPEYIQENRGGFQQPDFSQIDNMDQNGLQSYIDSMDYRARTGQNINEDDYLNLQRARRALAQQELPQYVDTSADAVARAEAEKWFLQTRARKQATNVLNAQMREIDSREQQEMRSAQESGDRLRQSQQSVLSFSWFGRSTYAAEKQSEIQGIVNQNIETIQATREAQRARAELEAQNAPAEALKWYDEYIATLKKQSAETASIMATQMNEYNAQFTKDYQEKVDNILQMALEMDKSEIPLTEDDIATAWSYASLLINGKWEINEAVLKIIPDNIKSATLKIAAEKQWAIAPTNEFGFINVWEGQVAVTDPLTWEVTYKQWPRQPDAPKVVEIDWVDSVFNTKTWEFEAVSISTWPIVGIWSGVVTAYGTDANPYGLDVDGKIWDPIITPVAWEVVEVGSDEWWYGNFVIVKDASGNSVRYAHLNNANVSVGDKITAWSSIGAVGNTWYTIPWEGGDGSHVDITLFDSNGNPKSAREVETYLTEWQRGVAETTIRPERSSFYNRFNSKESKDKLTASELKAIESAGVSFDEFGRQAQEYKKQQDKQIQPQARELLSLLEEIRDISGGDYQKLRTWLVWEGRDLRTTFDRIKSSIALQQLIDLKAEGATFGALSENELSFIVDSATDINYWGTRKKFNARVEQLINKLNKGIGSVEETEAEETWWEALWDKFGWVTL